LINEVAKYVPRRRKRKLHIGLFGYSRNLDGVKLPRAISFCCSLYSLGIPPEIIGLDSLSHRDLDYVRQVSPHFDQSMRDALRYMNPESMSALSLEVPATLKDLKQDLEIDEKHRRITSEVMDKIKRPAGKEMGDLVLRAAHLRGFLG
jgi:phosphoenolpyruvate carboxylase